MTRQTIRCQRPHRFKRLELKSLESIWVGLFILIVQVVCIARACKHYKEFKTASWEPFIKPIRELWFYLFSIGIAVLFLPIYAFTSFFKIGSYANDDFKFGQDFNANDLVKKPAVKLNSKLLTMQERKSIHNQSTHYSLMPSSNEPNAHQFFSDSKSNMKQAPFSTSSIISSAYSDLSHQAPNQILVNMRAMFSLSNVWKNLPPVANLAHLSIAFMLLLPSVLLTAKEIEYGLRPKGFVHHSQLDFFFQRPLDRFSESQNFLDPSPFYFDNVNPNRERGQVNYYMSKSQIKIQLISSSLDDVDQVNYAPQISLEFFSYLLALSLIALRFSGTLWGLNKIYAFIFSVHLIMVGVVSALSFSAFEILYKFQSCFASGIKLKLTNVTNSTTNQNFNQVVFNLPFATSPVTLLVSFLGSILLFMLSAVPVYAYALYHYRLKLKKLCAQFNRHVVIPPRSSRERSQCYYEEAKNVYLHGSSAASTSESSDQALYLTNSQSDSPETNSGQSDPLLDKSSKQGDEMAGQFPNNFSSNPPPLPAQPPPAPLSQTKTSKNSTKLTSESDLTDTSSISLEHSTISLTANLGPKPKHTYVPFFAIYAPYKTHIFALIILLALCFHTAVVVYDLICLYQLTSDTVPFWAAIADIGFILWYICLWLVLTFKTHWKTEFTVPFKLTMWTAMNRQTNQESLRSSACSSADSFRKQTKQRMLTNNSYNEYNEFQAKRPNYASQRKGNDKRLLKPNSLSMSNLDHASQGSMQRQTGNKERRGSRNDVFSSSGLLVSDAMMSSNYTPGCDYDAEVTPYENFNTMTNLSDKSRTLTNMGKKQPSLRRVNQLITTEQRLPPVLENTSAYNPPTLKQPFTTTTTSKPPSGDTSINQQLYLLRKSLNKVEKTYETPNTYEESSSSSEPKELRGSTNNGKSTESIYNLSKSKTSLMNYTSISELEKRASAIMINSKLAKNTTNNNTDLSGSTTNVKQTTVPLHVAQQKHEQQKRSSSGAENSPKSQISSTSECLSSGSTGSQQTNPQMHDTDSGRHSLSDSPPNAFYASTKTSPGTFTSRVVTTNISQTGQRFRQTNDFISKKTRSTSRDHGMTKSSSFCKSGLPPVGGGHAVGQRSQSSDRRGGGLGSNGNLLNQTVGSQGKRSSSSINRNCSDL